MKKHWFRERLIPIKQRSEMWSELADSVERMILSNVESTLTRLRNRVSIFDMDKEDLGVLLSEMGKFFVLGNISDDDAALVLMQREDEIHLKRTLYPLINTINREFKGLQVAWQPQYAPADIVKYPYCSDLKPKDTADMLKNIEWFLTSRGAIKTDLDELNKKFSNFRDPVGAFENAVRMIIYPLVPLRIVCDCIRFCMTIITSEQERDPLHDLARMDAIRCDCVPLDYDNPLSATEKKSYDLLNTAIKKLDV